MTCWISLRMNKMNCTKFSRLFTKREFSDIHISDKPFKSLQHLIRRETEIVTNHLTPEIKLHLITTNCRLFHQTVDENFPFAKDPFWAFYWPGGQGVSRYILDNPEVVKGKSVLDFGSGSAACSIAAKMCGSTLTLANDIDETAEVAAILNANLNNVSIQTETKNLINDPATYNYDVILLGDVFYDQEIADLLHPWLEKVLKNKQRIIIGDPGRHALRKNMKLNLLAKYSLPENICIENHGFQYTNVWEFIKGVQSIVKSPRVKGVHKICHVNDATT